MLAQSHVTGINLLQNCVKPRAASIEPICLYRILVVIQSLAASGTRTRRTFSIPDRILAHYTNSTV